MSFAQLIPVVNILLLTGPAADDTGSDSAQIRTAIQKSLPYIERDGEKWIRTKKCNSCHMIPQMLWSLHEAGSRGLKINTDRLTELDEWSAADIVKLEPGRKPPRGSETQAQLLIIRTGYEGPLDDRFHRMLNRVIEARQENGQWQAGGQLPSQKRPKRETEEVSTMWNLLALRSVKGVVKDRDTHEAIARKWLSDGALWNNRSAESAEWFTLRLMLESKWGQPTAVEKARSDLLARQRPDGGWGWLTGSESDALATGPAIWALTQTGTGGNTLPVQRAVKFLLRTQRDDGTWRVESTRAKDRGEVRPTSVYWGTTWATIGLAQLLPRTGQTELQLRSVESPASRSGQDQPEP